MTRAHGSATTADGGRPLEKILVFLTAFLVLAAGAFWGLPSGKSVAGALVILDGGAPYRDFWTMYAPGQFYAVAALYRLFGRELLVQGLATAAVLAVSAVVFNRLMQRLGAKPAAALLLTAVFVLMSWTTAPDLTDYELALPWLLLALDRAVRYYLGLGPTHLRWAGVYLGAAAWFKHDVAAYVALGAAISLFASWWLLRGSRPAAWISPVRATASIAVPAIAMAAPLAVWTAWTAGAAAWNDLFVFPAAVFSKVRNERFPPLMPDLTVLAGWLADPTHVRRALRAADSLSTWAVLWTPTAAFAIAVAALPWLRRRLDAASLASVTLCVACMPFFWAAAQVQHNTHPRSLAVLTAGAGVVVLSRLAGAGPAWWRVPAALAMAVYAGGLLATPAVRAGAVYYEWEGSRLLDLPGFRGVRVPARVYDVFHPLGTFFRTHTAEGEPIYTGLVRHDAIVINNALLYAIAGRPACCGVTELHPGVADRAPVQEAIVGRLEAGRVRAIALWRFGWSDEVMAARKQHTMAGVPDAGATILDRYIHEHFETIETHGEYHILWRRGVPLPAGAAVRPPGADGS